MSITGEDCEAAASTVISAAPGPQAAPCRQPGRPRSERAEAAIVNAALEMLVEHGFGALSMEGVAARAGVGKATIYRRWRNKSELLVDAVMRVEQTAVPAPDTGNLRTDLVMMLDQVRERMAASLAGRLMPRLMSAAMDDPELMRLYWARSVWPRRNLTLARLRAAQQAGELRADLDAEALCDSLFGPLVYAKLFNVVRPLPTHERVEQLVELFLCGAQPR